MNWRKWNSAKKARSEQARHAAQVRWERYHALDPSPPRETRTVEITIIDSHRPMQIIRMQAEETERGWGRWLVRHNGHRLGERRFGRSAIADLLARLLM